jgi:hypothetical protein
MYVDDTQLLFFVHAARGLLVNIIQPTRSRSGSLVADLAKQSYSAKNSDNVLWQYVDGKGQKGLSVERENSQKKKGGREVDTSKVSVEIVAVPSQHNNGRRRRVGRVLAWLLGRIQRQTSVP